MLTFGKANLADVLDEYVPRDASSGYVLHGNLVSATTALACWLACCQREFAHLATGKLFALSW